MRKRKIVIWLMIVLVISNIFVINVSAYERKDHDDFLEDMLFKSYKNLDTDKEAKKIFELITAACYLCIDQTNSNGKKDLELLKEYGVEGLPDDVLEIGEGMGGKNHRSNTHRGWTPKSHIYTKVVKEKWQKRKEILVNTVDKIFDFGDDTEKCDSFCEMLYCIHIIADHLDDEDYKKAQNNGLKMPVADSHGNDDTIIKSLLDDFDVLFEDIKEENLNQYNGLTTKLDSLNIEISEIVHSTGGINSEEKFDEHKKLVENLKEALESYLPKLLRKEKFFADVFYK